MQVERQARVEAGGCHWDVEACWPESSHRYPFRESMNVVDGVSAVSFKVVISEYDGCKEVAAQ